MPFYFFLAIPRRYGLDQPIQERRNPSVRV
jgi:hypothetical protein